MNFQYLIPLSSSLHNVMYTLKTILLGALTAETISYLLWRRDRCLATFGSLKIDVERVLIYSLSVFNSNLYKRPHTLHSFGKSIQVLLFTIFPLSGIVLDGIHNNFKVMFPVYGFRLTIFRPYSEHIS